MMLITGKSDLSTALVKRFSLKYPCVVAGRPEYDFSKQSDCDRLIELHPAPTILINTLGTISDDYWNNLTVNFVAPSYITLQYINKTNHCHIINISSASTMWVSHPGLDFERFTYNIAKESLSNLDKHVNRVIVDQDKNIVLSTIEPGCFQSKMSNYQGMGIENVVDTIEYAIKHKVQHTSIIR